MPNRRASTDAEKLAVNLYSWPITGRTPVTGSGVPSTSTSNRATLNSNSPTRPNEREPSTSSPRRRSAKWPLEVIQPSACMLASPKKSTDALTAITQSPTPSVTLWSWTPVSGL